VRGVALAAALGGSLAAVSAQANTDTVPLSCVGSAAEGYSHLGDGVTDTTMESETFNTSGDCYYAYLFAYNVRTGQYDSVNRGWTNGYQSPDWFESGGALSHNEISGDHNVCLTTLGNRL
jgi:hypothetical protein